MAVRITLSKTFRAPINFETLDEKGKRENQSYTAEFKRLTTEEVSELTNSGRKDVEMLVDVLAGWDITDANGDAVPCTPEKIREISNNLPGIAGISMFKFVETCGAAKAKN